MHKASHSSLRQLLDKLTSNLEALRVLEVPVNAWDALIVTIIHEKLDNSTKTEWQKMLDAEIPKLADFIKFLEKRLEILASFETVIKPQQTYKGFSNIHKTNNYQSSAPKQFSYVATHKAQCAQCKRATHNIYQCTQFLKLSTTERVNQTEKLNLCKNCLRNNHSTEECRSNQVCTECKQKHHSLLHLVANKASSSEISRPSCNLAETSATSVNCSNCRIVSSCVLLSTALVYIKDCKGKFQESRALLDVGSQYCFISIEMCGRLGLQCENVNIPVAGINQNYSTITQAATIEIKSRINNFTAELKCLLLPKITQNIPLESFNVECVKIPPNIILADPKFNESRQIDLLIGADLFWKLLCDGRIQTKVSQPLFQKTQLGWVIGGTINLPAAGATVACNLSLNAKRGIERLESGLNKFWELEEYPTKKILSFEERECEQRFKDSVRRTPEGRFMVKLPVNGNNINLGCSYELALKRFYSLEKRLGKQPQLKEQYSQFITEYLELNHMEAVPDNELNNAHCYLPHHAVIKDASTTTKLRVVFDASAKTTNGLSLNDNLMCGPVVQQDLFTILTRFRTFQYVLTGDIAIMYRQIMIHPSQMDYQRILWRNNADDSIQSFRLRTLTYGNKPASFLATRCLQELASNNQNNYPVTSGIINNHLYMDDLLTGGNSVSEVVTIREEVTSILASTGFELRKFASNHIDILPTDGDERNNNIVNLDKNNETKTLGLLWNCAEDILKYESKSQTAAPSKKITKRSILSVIAHIFDPLGLLGPIIMKAKVTLQQLWTLKLDWDEMVPNRLHTEWSEFISQLLCLDQFKIDRKVIAVFPACMIELHGFCDASQSGYGAAIYLRSTDGKNKQATHLLCSKSKVAPLKTISVPRLELCAAPLLAKLAHAVNSNLSDIINKCYMWTDSTIVLAWLSLCPSTLNTFVANRVSEIQSLTPVTSWNHVKSEENPADILSRGQLPRELLESQLWFHGPVWLNQDGAKVPSSFADFSKIEIIEQRKVALVVNKAQCKELSCITKYSNFVKLQRVIAYCLRFIKNCKNKAQKRVEMLSLAELQYSKRVIIKSIQGNEFSNEVSNLKDNKAVGKDSSLITLDPFLDEQGLIRVGGRLRNAPGIGSDKKYPIILPNKHYVTKLIIEQEHITQLHAGAQAILASLRQKYWIIDARSIIRRTLHKCIKCFRINPRPVVQKMGDLPKNRLELKRPFLNSGIDYAGPIFVKEGKGRGKRKIKAYIALFVCLATKAVHLELVGDLTTESFMGALKRFIARRGCVKILYSDNATNFIGAKRELEELHNLLNDTTFKNKLYEALSPVNIMWKFIPPRAPNMGGLWEINVKSIKYHLRRVLGDSLLNFEEMYTLLTRIEACINSRPLTPLSSDPNDLVALTPGHFLIGAPLTTPVEDNITDLKTNRLSRWQHVEQLRQHFWKRWQREYLLQLQQRSKWPQAIQENLRVGDLVVITEDNIPPQQWLLGSVTELHPGADKIVRVVSVKTVRGITIKRSVRRMCPLPLYDGNQL